MEIVCKNENETKKLAKKIADILTVDDFLCLDGDLGAGKTTFTRYLCQALGVTGYITSPSYNIVNEYDGNVEVNHFDVYRIYSIDELYEIGYEEYFHSERINIIEWAVKIKELIPEGSIWIYISLGENFNERIFRIKGLDNRLDFM